MIQCVQLQPLLNLILLLLNFKLGLLHNTFVETCTSHFQPDHFSKSVDLVVFHKPSTLSRTSDEYIPRYILSTLRMQGEKNISRDIFPMAYEFIHQNMPEALPCMRTVQTSIHAEYKTIDEGAFRFDELKKHIDRCKDPAVIFIGEDAT